MSGYLVFSSAWLRGRGIDTTRCVVAVMPGTAMEPSIADGAFVLVDQSCQAAREGRVYVVTAHAGDWSVNRVVLQGRRWVLSSDRAGVTHTAWRPGLELSGEVVWVASAVPKMRVNGRGEDVIFFDGVFFKSSLKSIFFVS